MSNPSGMDVPKFRPRSQRQFEEIGRFIHNFQEIDRVLTYLLASYMMDLPRRTELSFTHGVVNALSFDNKKKALSQFMETQLDRWGASLRRGFPQQSLEQKNLEERKTKIISSLSEVERLQIHRNKLVHSHWDGLFRFQGLETGVLNPRLAKKKIDDGHFIQTEDFIVGLADSAKKEEEVLKDQGLFEELYFDLPDLV